MTNKVRGEATIRLASLMHVDCSVLLLELAIALIFCATVLHVLNGRCKYLLLVSRVTLNIIACVGVSFTRYV